MWETIKNDPLLKTLTIIILGVLGFGFAFNIMFGTQTGGMGHHGGMTVGGGYSLENTLAYTLSLAFKVFLIALVVISLIALFKLARKYLFQGGEIKMFESIKNDPVLKVVTIVVLSVVAIGLLFMLFGYLPGANVGYSHNYMSNGAGVTGFSAILLFLIKILLVLFIAGAVIGLVMYFRQNYSSGIISRLSSFNIVGKAASTCAKCGFKAADDYKFCPSCGESMKTACTSCGAELKPEWKCCPSCGTDNQSQPNNSQTGSEKTSGTEKE